jgi:nitrous oxide reductase
MLASRTSSAPSRLTRRLMTAGATIALTAGLGAGVASADSLASTAAPKTTTTSSLASTKDAPADMFNCDKHPNLWYCG